MNNPEVKNIGGLITGFKQLDRKGIPVGIVEGYIATWDIDRGNDKFMPGAFLEHLTELRQQNRAIRLKDMHGRTVGTFPIENVKEDGRGLFGIGEINLEVQQGQELYSLVKQGAMTDFSIGFTAKEVEFENGIRVIMKSKVWEGSVVDEPMNPHANITDVKTVNSRLALPKEFTDLTVEWKSEEAKANKEEYKNAFINWDSDYALQVADLIDGELKIIPKAVFAAKVKVSGIRGELPFTHDEEIAVKTTINVLYQDMNLEAPFEKDRVRPVCKTELKSLTKSDFCYTIQNCKLSRDAANYITSLAYPAIMGESSNDSEMEVLNDLIQDLKKVTEEIQ